MFAITLHSKLKQMRIKEILKEKGMTQQDLADAITPSVSLSAVKQMVNASSLTTETLNKIAKALNVPIWELFASREEILGDTANISTAVCPHCKKPIILETTIRQ